MKVKVIPYSDNFRCKAELKLSIKYNILRFWDLSWAIFMKDFTINKLWFLQLWIIYLLKVKVIPTKNISQDIQCVFLKANSFCSFHQLKIILQRYKISQNLRLDILFYILGLCKMILSWSNEQILLAF